MTDLTIEDERPSGPRWALREATADLHEAVDAAFGAYDLSHRDDYRRFLSVMASVFVPVERALDASGAERVIDDWASRRRADDLRADLTDLRADADEGEAAPRFESDAALLGAAYVLEGSRLGGRMLKRGLPVDAPQRFLGAEGPRWPAFVANLDCQLQSPKALDEAVASAREVFARFQRAAAGAAV